MVCKKKRKKKKPKRKKSLKRVTSCWLFHLQVKKSVVKKKKNTNYIWKRTSYLVQLKRVTINVVNIVYVTIYSCYNVRCPKARHKPSDIKFFIRRKIISTESGTSPIVMVNAGETFLKWYKSAFSREPFLYPYLLNLWNGYIRHNAGGGRVSFWWPLAREKYIMHSTRVFVWSPW